MFKIIKRFVYKGEFLEFNLEDEINKRRNKRLIFLYTLFRKILRNNYKIIQRILIKPTIRNKFSHIESIIINFFKKKKIYYK